MNLSYEALCLTWFALLVVLLIGYAILDGFDLGVGMLHLWVAKDDTERRLVMNSIGPLWDGNEVWLVTFGGALFAAFPEAYATTFSAFYTPFMLLLFALIFRAVSLEFRSKVNSPIWRRAWDVGFAVGSGGAALLFGVAVGNSMLGIPLDERFEFVGTLRGMLNPYAVVVGLLAVTMMMMHGAIFLHLKTEGALHQRLERWMWGTFFAFLACLLTATVMTGLWVPHAIQPFMDYPWLWAVPAVNLLCVANIPRAIYRKRAGFAFVSSCTTIACSCILFATATFPYLVRSWPNPENSLTVYNAASSEKTLGIMLLIAAIGIPCVLSYTAIIYWTFRGKVELGHQSY